MKINRTPGKKRRSARLRKKLHIDEFQEFGFSYEAVLDESLTQEQIEIVVDAFLDEVIEPRQLGLGGWLDGGYVQGMERPSATDDDRAAVRVWLESRREVISVRVSPLTDCWYPPE